jgi:hypothetical protein
MKTSLMNLEANKKYSMYIKPQGILPRATSATLKKNSLDSFSLPLFKTGVQVTNPKNNLNTSRNKPANNYNIDKEKLYEECINLKNSMNSLHKELHFYKAEVHKREMELRRQNKAVEDMLGEQQGNYLGINPSDLQNKIISKVKENSLISNLKKKYTEVKNELKEKTLQLEEIKKTMKSTKINEIILENQTLLEELSSMRGKVEFLQGQNLMFERLQKEYIILQDNVCRQDNIILQLQEEIQTMQKGTSRPIKSAKISSPLMAKTFLNKESSLASNSQFQILTKELE